VFFCSGALLRVDEKKAVHKYLEIGPAGTVLRADGHMLIADNKFKAILDVSPEGKVQVIAERWEGQAFRSLNDLTIDARGNVYWTDPKAQLRRRPWVASFASGRTGAWTASRPVSRFPTALMSIREQVSLRDRIADQENSALCFAR